MAQRLSPPAQGGVRPPPAGGAVTPPPHLRRRRRTRSTAVGPPRARDFRRLRPELRSDRLGALLAAIATVSLVAMLVSVTTDALIAPARLLGADLADTLSLLTGVILLAGALRFVRGSPDGLALAGGALLAEALLTAGSNIRRLGDPVVLVLVVVWSVLARLTLTSRLRGLSPPPPPPSADSPPDRADRVGAPAARGSAAIQAAREAPARAARAWASGARRMRHSLWRAGFPAGTAFRRRPSRPRGASRTRSGTRRADR